MPINTLNDYLASSKQLVTYNKTSTRTTVASIPFSVFDIAGNPGAGTLAIGNTANGVVPTDAVAGYPIIHNFAVGATGHIARISFSNTVASRVALYDRVFAAGAYSFNSDITLASQPSYAGRIPNGDYKGLELWLEAVTAFTGNQSIRIQYLDQDGNAGDTGTIATGITPIVGRMYRMPYAAGDTGIQRINVVTSTVSSAGTFNVMILRKLFEGRVKAANDGDTFNPLRTGNIRVYEDSALYVVVSTDATSAGYPSLDIEIASY